MLIKNCKIVTPREIINANILVEEERIADIGRTLKARGEEAINARGKPVIPGVIDAHVHMRDFEQNYKEDFYSGTCAALAGGVTTILDMPNSKPPVTSASLFQRRIETAQKKALVDFGINFGITSNNLNEIEKVNPVAFKIYMDGGLGEISDAALEEAIKRCPRVAVHAEDAAIIKRNAQFVKEDEDNFLIHGDIREPEAEERAVAKVCELAKRHRKHVHICHISYRKSLRYLNEYTTCEATPHHLLLTETELKEQGGVAKTNPPLRSPLDLRALWDALKSGRINMIASDHAPHRAREKEGAVLSTPSGMPNLDVTLRLFLTLVNKGTLTLQEFVALMCENPARIFGLGDKGAIERGKHADLLVLNMDKKGKIEADEFYSKAKYTPSRAGALAEELIR